MVMKVKAIITFVLVCMVQFGFAQKEFIKAADKLYNAGAFSEAAPMYLSLLQQTYNYDQNKKLAFCYLQLNMVNDAEHWYSVLANQNAGEPEILLNYAQLLKANGKYRTAKQWFLEYAKYNDDGYYLAGTCDFAEALKLQPQSWALDTISINSKGSEIAPAYYRSGIIYASTGEVTGNKNEKLDKSAGLPFYDLYYTAKGSDGNFRSSSKLEMVNTELHEAGAVFDTKSNQLIFTRNNYYKGKQLTASDKSVKLEMFVSQFVEAEFKKAKPFVIGNKEYSVGQPCISPDGSIIIFTSDMPGGFGGTDLYFSQRMVEGWTVPVNMGPVINTKGNEMFPFLASTGELFFASNWHPGLGGYDIFISERNQGSWAKPANPGKPVNSSRDDFAFIMQNGLGYLSSNRPGGKGSDDIYACTRLQEIQSLLVRNAKLQNVIGAKITIYEGDRISSIGYTDVKGMLPVALNSDASFAVSIEKDGYIETQMVHVEQYRSNNGILPVHLQELYDVNEVPDLHKEEIITETPSDEIEFLEMNAEEAPPETIVIPAAVISDTITQNAEEEIETTEAQSTDNSSTEIVSDPAISETEEVAEVLAVSTSEVIATIPEPGEQEVPAETIVEETSIEPVAESAEADVVTYEVQLGVFRNPDYTKTEAFKKYGEVQSLKKDDGTFKVSVNNIVSKTDAETVRTQALEKGFAGAYIITYKNGVRIN